MDLFLTTLAARLGGVATGLPPVSESLTSSVPEQAALLIAGYFLKKTFIPVLKGGHVYVLKCYINAVSRPHLHEALESRRLNLTPFTKGAVM